MIKRWGMVLGIIAGMLVAGTVWAASTITPTGVTTAGAAKVVEFSTQIRTMLAITNRSSQPIYVKFYRDYVEDTDTTVSKNVFDAELDTSETLILGRDILLHAPVEQVGIYGVTGVYNSTTPTLSTITISGWR